MKRSILWERRPVLKLSRDSKDLLLHALNVHRDKAARNAVEGAAEDLGLDLRTAYGSSDLKNPFIVAPGQMTVRQSQVRSLCSAGYAGAVLKSVIGEDPDGVCSVPEFRRAATRVESFYEPWDTGRTRPIIHWNGRGDTRGLGSYLSFAESALGLARESGVVLAASLLCRLPRLGEEWPSAEWEHTTRALAALGFRLFEIDFCPYLDAGSADEAQRTMLRWHREGTRIVKNAAPGIEVFPKVLNPMFGEEFFVEMCAAAAEGGADGLVIANRIYKPEFQSGHGGEELRKLNLKHIRACREAGIALPISATGGVYSGVEALEYILAGAQNVQLLSMIMGKVHGLAGPGDKFEQVLRKLMLDAEDGLLAGMLAIRDACGASGIREITGRWNEIDLPWRDR